MRVARYSRWTLFDWSELDLHELVAQLGDHLLESGFQKQFRNQLARWLKGAEEDDSEVPEDPLNELRRQIARILRDTDYLDDEQYSQLFDAEGNAKDENLVKLIDQLIARMLEEGFIKLEVDGQSVSWTVGDDGRVELDRESFSEFGHIPSNAEIRVELTRKGMDFLGYRSLKHLLQGRELGAVGTHETERQSTGVEAYESSKPYEFGDTLQLDHSETLKSAIKARGLRGVDTLDYDDLFVRQSKRYTSCATVLMLDCSHSMILYGEDRFTPAKKVALALSQLIRTQYPGDSLNVVLFHDSAEEVPLSRLANVQVGPYHTNTCEGLRLARSIAQAQRKELKQLIMITDGKPSALFVGNSFELGKRQGQSLYGRRLYKNSFGLDPDIVEATLKEARECRRAGVMLTTFMLTSDHYLVKFVEMLTQTAEGKAYMTSLDSVGQLVMEDFVGKR